MDVTPTNFPGQGNPAADSGAVLPGAGRASFGKAATNAMGMKWAALNDTAAVVATLAGIASEAMRPEVRNFPAIMRDVGGWRRDVAEQGVDDLCAIIEPGIVALMAAHARGINPAAAALALWQEFHIARNALLALAPAGVPMRSA